MFRSDPLGCNGGRGHSGDLRRAQTALDVSSKSRGPGGGVYSRPHRLLDGGTNRPGPGEEWHAFAVVMTAGLTWQARPLDQSDENLSGGWSMIFSLRGVWP